MTAIPTQIDLTTPRTVAQILGTALRIYARLPLLFVFLAGIIVVPYEVAAVLVEQGKNPSATVEILLLLAGLALVNPCIFSLEMQALIDLGEGRRPKVASVIRRALAVLPVVAATEIIAGLSEGTAFLISIALVIFIVPAVYLVVRLAVAAPAAATEGTNWPSALRRSIWLTRGNFWRVLGLQAIQALLLYIVALVIGDGSSLPATIGGFALAIVAYSFCTLLFSLLYFDLRARERAPVA